jgi:ABC-type bacteriocin/lantibiotic exporter with double-glycine peptidase domain
MAEAKRRREAREREASMCGPEVLAEAFRRVQGSGSRGQGTTTDDRRPTISTEALAAEMGTSHEGTSLLAMAEAARRRGFKARGLMLTEKGLLKQRFPLIALVNDSHFVLVEAANRDSVTVWDPDGAGEGKANRQIVAGEKWKGMWGGVALSLR